MHEDLLKINFYFPDIQPSKEKVVEKIIDLMTADGGIEFSGYADDDALINDLSERIGEGALAGQAVLSESEKQQITDEIHSSVKKCNEVLANPEGPVSIFVFPWFPTSNESHDLEGVNAFTVYKNTIHVFLDLKTYTRTSLKETVAHEYSHVIYYHYHYSESFTVLESIYMEGLAENFREEAMGGKQAIWATALSKEEAMEWLSKIHELLLNSNSKVIGAVLLGNDTYPRWMGYSIGYHVVKDFRKESKHLTWDDIGKLHASNAIGNLIK